MDNYIPMCWVISLHNPKIKLWCFILSHQTDKLWCLRIRIILQIFDKRLLNITLWFSDFAMRKITRQSTYLFITLFLQFSLFNLILNFVDQIHKRVYFFTNIFRCYFFIVILVFKTLWTLGRQPNLQKFVIIVLILSFCWLFLLQRERKMWENFLSELWFVWP